MSLILRQRRTTPKNSQSGPRPRGETQFINRARHDCHPDEKLEKRKRSISIVKILDSKSMNTTTGAKDVPARVKRVLSVKLLFLPVQGWRFSKLFCETRNAQGPCTWLAASNTKRRLHSPACGRAVSMKIPISQHTQLSRDHHLSRWRTRSKFACDSPPCCST